MIGSILFLITFNLSIPSDNYKQNCKVIQEILLYKYTHKSRFINRIKPLPCGIQSLDDEPC